MFDLLVKRFGFLKHIPFAAIGIDGMLRCRTVVFNRSLSKCLDEIEEEISKWEGVTMVLHKYGGAQFNVGSKEIGHVHGNGLLDVLLTRRQKEELIMAGKAQEHHVFKDSGWISFYIRSISDKDNALELLRISWEQKQNRK